MGNLRDFPILLQGSRDELQRLRYLCCPKVVRWDFVAPHERQAHVNHDQTLQRLAERGGLSPAELVAVVRGERWARRAFLSDVDAVPELDRLLREFTAGIAKDVDRHQVEAYEVERCWAVFSGCEGDSPSFVGLIENELIARALVTARDAEGDPLFTDAMAIPAMVIGATAYVANDYRVDTHDELEAVLKTHGIGEQGVRAHGGAP